MAPDGNKYIGGLKYYKSARVFGKITIFEKTKVFSDLQSAEQILCY